MLKLKAEIYVEINGIQTDTQMLTDVAKDIWKGEGNRLKDMKTLEIYFKPNENVCYYVINGDVKGQFEVNQT
ncbi:MAG: DUF6465 family protein [Defluviitaleaceae bacterium]|nr:DUF6465 family protein [Defluviitaleaceae bacterium]